MLCTCKIWIIFSFLIHLITVEKTFLYTVYKQSNLWYWINKHFSQVSSNHQSGYATVDYILYSTVHSPRFGKIEGNLKLISRLNLLSGNEVTNLGGLPSLAFPSDHLCLAAKFLLRGSRGRRWKKARFFPSRYEKSFKPNSYFQIETKNLYLPWTV